MNKLLVLTLGLLVSGLATSQEATTWQYRLSPYIWFAGSKGEVSSLPNAPAVPYELSSRDALEDTESSFMIMFSGKKQGQGFLLDFIYTDVESLEELIPALDLTLTSRSKNTVFTAAYQYELINENGTVIDAYAGVRYWDVDSTLKFGGGLGFLAGQTVKNSDDWLDPVLGFKFSREFVNSRVYLQGWLSLGGFGAGSDSFYDTSINLGYRWSDSIGTSIGYRLFDVDYDDNDFIYNAKNEGWAIGLTWQF